MTFELNHLFKDLISKYSHILRSWGLGLQHVPQPGAACWVSHGLWHFTHITNHGGHTAASQAKVLQLWNPSPRSPCPWRVPWRAETWDTHGAERSLRCYLFQSIQSHQHHEITFQSHLPGKARFQTQVAMLTKAFISDMNWLNILNYIHFDVSLSINLDTAVAGTWCT